MNSPINEMAAVIASDKVLIDARKVRNELQPPVRDRSENTSQHLGFRGSQRVQRLTGFGIRSIGSYVPSRIVTNEELEAKYGFEPGWIERRTGIKQRRFAADTESTSDLAVEAARRGISAA